MGLRRKLAELILNDHAISAMCVKDGIVNLWLAGGHQMELKTEWPDEFLVAILTADEYGNLPEAVPRPTNPYVGALTSEFDQGVELNRNGEHPHSFESSIVEQGWDAQQHERMKFLRNHAIGA